MHIMEGFLPVEWAVFWFAISIPVIAWGFLKIRRLFSENPELKMSIAISGAFIFALSSLKLPSVTGSSSHPTGTGASTILHGVAVTSVLSIIVLLFQAILLAHGGLTTLGANVFSMGIAGPFVGWLAYKGMQRAKVSMLPTVFITALLANLATYVVTALQLALAYPTAGSVITSFTTFFEIFAVTQVPLAVAEGVLFAMFFDYLARTRPDLLKGKLHIKDKVRGVADKTVEART
ncbi:MAG: energy-coupling factor ABC transporter permease [Methanomassiliicoccus sp.]|nr:energy-coupling factor ABC transporter permease [Methanomassiliicoccus sp.]